MSPTTRRRTRLITGCQRCRARHLKCDTNLPSCAHCQRAGIGCNRGCNVRFRRGLLLPTDTATAFPGQDLWPCVVGPVEFRDETEAIQQLYEVVPSSQLLDEDCRFGGSRGHPSSSPFIDDPSSSHPACPTHSGYRSVGVSAGQSSHDSGPVGARARGPVRTIIGHPGDLSTDSPPSSQQSKTHHPCFSAREATLMRNFIENMALWADITDPDRQFETNVPVKAVQEPALRSAIFAFSSRHIDRQRKVDASEALQYHNHCLQLLIPALSGSRADITDVVLATVAVLRQHEEMEPDDNQFHLTGTARILNTISSFGSSGGLGEAAAWLCLREDIYIALISQKPLRTNLQSFHRSNVWVRDDDFAWASRMVFLLAKVLSCAFSPCGHESSLDLSGLQRLAQEVEAWNGSKPTSFDAIRSVPRGADLEQRFPEIWMLLPVHVVGAQYYHIAKIVLAVTTCPSPTLVSQNFQVSRHIEKVVRHHLFMVLGLAKSNPKAENTLFTARHSLVAWGWVIRRREDQEASEALLREMETRTGWDVTRTIQALREQWADDDSDC